MQQLYSDRLIATIDESKPFNMQHNTKMWLYLFPDECNNSYPGENMLSRQAFPGNSICKFVRVVRYGFAKVSHEQWHVGLEDSLGLSSEVANQPLMEINRKRIYHSEVYEF